MIIGVMIPAMDDRRFPGIEDEVAFCMLSPI